MPGMNAPPVTECDGCGRATLEIAPDKDGDTYCERCAHGNRTADEVRRNVALERIADDVRIGLADGADEHAIRETVENALAGRSHPRDWDVGI